MEASLRSGASRVFCHPLQSEDIFLVLNKIATLWDLRCCNTSRDSGQTQWIGKSMASEKIKEFVAQMTGEQIPILIEGESGSGKEVVAQLLQQKDRDRPFIVVNAAAISENLFESEFYGHVKGAFTGAIQHRLGFVALAHGGDLFIDEIEALSLPFQAKLLRFLETGEYFPVGSSEVRHSQVRIVAATNECLESLVEKSLFRKDLYFRLCGYHLKIPPLRERLEDIEPLCHFFLRKRLGRSAKRMDPEALEALKKYSWPGNVRELKRACERLNLHAPLPIIRSLDVRELMLGASGPRATGQYRLGLGLQQLLADHEKNVLSFALEQSDDVDILAKLLKISRSSLYKKVKDYGLEIKSR